MPTRLDKLVAERFGLSRRAAQDAVRNGRIDVAGERCDRAGARGRARGAGRILPQPAQGAHGRQPASGAARGPPRPGRGQAGGALDLAHPGPRARHAGRSCGPLPVDPPRRPAAVRRGGPPARQGHLRGAGPGALAPGRPRLPGAVQGARHRAPVPRRRRGGRRSRRGDDRPGPGRRPRRPAPRRRPEPRRREAGGHALPCRRTLRPGRHAARLLARDRPDPPDPHPSGRDRPPRRRRRASTVPASSRAPRPGSRARRCTPRPSASSIP